MNNRIEYLLRFAVILGFVSLTGLAVSAQTTPTQPDTLYVFESGDGFIAITKKTAEGFGMKTTEALRIVIRERDCEAIPFSLEEGADQNYLVRSRTPGVRCED